MLIFNAKFIADKADTNQENRLRKSVVFVMMRACGLGFERTAIGVHHLPFCTIAAAVKRRALRCVHYDAE